LVRASTFSSIKKVTCMLDIQVPKSSELAAKRNLRKPQISLQFSADICNVTENCRTFSLLTIHCIP
jgi:hypothetical protein